MLISLVLIHQFLNILGVDEMSKIWMYQFISIAASVTTLFAGCSDKQTQIPFLNRVLKADEFTSQSVLRKKVLTFCANDPGLLASDPNCINAKQSLRLSSSGSGDFPRFDTSLPPITKHTSKNK